jgi:Tol biopolymer transport system component
MGQQPTLAPDGKRVLYSAVINRNFLAAQIRESDLDGRNETAITRDAGAHFNGAYSPDGRQVAYAHLDSATRDMQVWVVNRDGSNARQLTRFTGTEGRPQWPSWSPDGNTLAVQAGVYNRDTPAQNTAHIWLIDVTSGKATKIGAHDTPYLDETPSFLPDGRIAFQSNRTGRMEIWVMHRDGTNARQVTK